MKRTTINYSILAITLIFATFFISCKKMVEVDPPKNQLVTSLVFKDSADATAAIVGIYATIMQFSTSVNFGSGAITVYMGLSADELYPLTTDAVPQQFYHNSVSPQNDQNAYWWVFAYQLIYHTNACIEGLSANSSLKTETKNQLLGEAKFIRAWLYFNLVNLYGDIPLATSIDYHTNAVLPRTPAEQVYSQLISDLKEAQQFLSPIDTSPGKQRPNRFTATALLSRVYLYQKQWAKAEEEATKVINSGLYLIEPDLNNVFRAAGKESIWQMPPLQPSLGTPECRQFIPLGSDIPSYLVTPTLLNEFESQDLRKSNWITSRTIDNVIYYFPYKYKLRVSATKDEYYVMLRLSEQHLIRAEARAMQNDLVGALADLNAIRIRAGLNVLTSNNPDEILTAIIHERQVELFCESGHRWYDLKRYQITNNVLGLLKPGWQSTDAMLPIPFSELQTNPFLVQNPGY